MGNCPKLLCLFHAAKAVLFSLGYQEKRHFAVLIVLEELSKQGKLESGYLADFNAAMYSREEADYHYGYSEDSARQICEAAQRFVERLGRVKG